MLAARIVVLSVVATGLLACGQKGPLVLPDAQHPRKKVTLPKTPTAPPGTPSPPEADAPSATTPRQ